MNAYCDGFACSIASVIFMAGDERIMSKSSLLMIHNAWMYVSGNASELRKQADDLDKITQASINAYLEHINISEEELKELLNKESWLTYNECIEMGFATSVINDVKDDKVSQSVKQSLVNIIRQFNSNMELQNQSKDENEDNTGNNNPNTTDSNPETDDSSTTDNSETDVDSDNDSTNDEDKENDDKKATERVIAFFNAMIGGM